MAYQVNNGYYPEPRSFSRTSPDGRSLSRGSPPGTPLQQPRASVMIPHDDTNMVREMFLDLRREVLRNRQEILSIKEPGQNSLKEPGQPYTPTSAVMTPIVGPGIQVQQGLNEQKWQQDLVSMKQTLVSIQQDIHSVKVQVSQYATTIPSYKVSRESNQDSSLFNGKQGSPEVFRGDIEQEVKGSLVGKQASPEVFSLDDEPEANTTKAQKLQQKKNQLMSEHGAPQLWSEFQAEIEGADVDNNYQVALEKRLAGKGFWHWLFGSFGLEQMLPMDMPNTALAHATNAPWFTACQTLLILSNTCFMGYETDAAIRGQLKDPPVELASWIETVNAVFNIVFTVELVFRIVALRAWFWVAAHNWGWNIFDVVLVTVSILSDWLFAGVNISFFRMLRILRVIRVARIIRILRFFRELRQMLFAIMACLNSLAWAFVFLFLVMFVFSVLFLQGLANTLDDLDYQSAYARDMRVDVDLWLGSLGAAMLSLLAAVTGGTDWLPIKNTINKAGWFYGGAFIAYLLFVTVGVMNVLTGVFLSSADEFFDLDLIGQREQVRVEAFIEQMATFFSEIDLTHTGEVDWPTFSRALKHDNLKAFLASMKLEPTHIRLIFDLLDEKRSGKIAMADFVMSMVKLKGEAKAVDARILQREISMIPMLLEK